MRFLPRIIGAVALGTPAVALAIVPPTPCTGLIGCGQGAENLILTNIPDLATLMITIAAGASVLFIAWAGLQMVLAMGNDSKLSEQKWAVAYVLGGLGLAILSQTIVSLVGTEPNVALITSQNLPVGAIAAGVNIILQAFNGIFAVVIIVAGIRMVYAQGKSDEFNAGRKVIFWSVVGAIVTNLANALVQAFAAIFGV